MSSKMPRVLFIIDSAARGGAESLICSLLSGLASRQVACYVACPSIGPMFERYARLATDIQPLGHRPLCHPAAIMEIVLLIKRWQIDVVHTCLYTSDFAGIMAARLAGRGRVISHVVGHNFLVTEERGVRRLRKRLLSLSYRIIYRWADQVVAVAEAVKTDLVQRRGARVPAEKIVVIPHALGEKVSHVAPESLERVRRMLSLEKDAVVVTAIGSLVPIKGHRFLIEAMKRVTEAIPNVTCVVVGEGPQRRVLEEQRRLLGLKERVVFAGGLDEDLKNAVVHMSRVVVLPSLSEGLSVALLEAMAHEKPVVATDAGGNREVVQEGVTALLVRPADAEALGLAIRRLLDDVPLAERLGQAGRCRFQEHFSMDPMLEKFEALYACHR